MCGEVRQHKNVSRWRSRVLHYKAPRVHSIRTQQAKRAVAAAQPTTAAATTVTVTHAHKKVFYVRVIRVALLFYDTRTTYTVFQAHTPPGGLLWAHARTRNPEPRSQSGRCDRRRAGPRPPTSWNVRKIHKKRRDTASPRFVVLVHR